MPWKPPSHYQLTRRRQRHAVRDAARDPADQAFYGSSRWQKLRQAVLADEPICRMCNEAVATLVDHIKPRHEHPELEWDRQNLSPLCVCCHARKTSHETHQRQHHPDRPVGGS